MAVTGVFVDIEKKLKGFELRIRMETKREALGILGASGSGKSMTLRCIAGIEKPDRGKIIINGRTVFDSEKKINVKPQERRVGYLFQNYALFPTMTTWQNIACGYHGKKDNLANAVDGCIRRFRLEGLENRYPSQLSGGQQQRAALARMMIGEPGIILMDEPFSALDGHLKDLMQREMQNYLKDYSGELILVTHSRDEAYKFCRQLALFEDGQVLACGPTREIFENPGFVNAARLTGCKNFSEIEKMGDHLVYAKDWGIELYTQKCVGDEITHIGIRGHWLKPAGQKGRNRLAVEPEEYIETTFEHQYVMKAKNMENGMPLWWMRPKGSFEDDPGEGIPPFLYFPEQHIMLLKDG